MNDGRPSFILLVTDQQRADHLGCYGHPVLRTPAIDGLARRGVRYDNCHVASPVCMPNPSLTFWWPILSRLAGAVSSSH